MKLLFILTTFELAPLVLGYYYGPRGGAPPASMQAARPPMQAAPAPMQARPPMQAPPPPMNGPPNLIRAPPLELKVNEYAVELNRKAQEKRDRWHNQQMMMNAQTAPQQNQNLQPEQAEVSAEIYPQEGQEEGQEQNSVYSFEQNPVPHQQTHPLTVSPTSKYQLDFD